MGAATGCAYASFVCGPPPPENEFVMVQYESGLGGGITAPPVVNETPNFTQMREGLTTIALRYPEHCVTEGAAVATGTSKNSDEIVMTECGVWLAELERSLTEQHYKVISWNALKQEAENDHISTDKAAEKLGAQIVLVVNSLGASDIHPGQTEGVLFRYFLSDEHGKKGKKVALLDEVRQKLKEEIKPKMQSADPMSVVGIAATVDVTAVASGSNEAVWFFRHSVTQPVASNLGMKFLFMRPSPLIDFALIRPDLPKVGTSTSAASSEDSEQRTIAAAPGDRYRAEKLKLVADVVHECVTKFRGGRR